MNPDFVDDGIAYFKVKGNLNLQENQLVMFAMAIAAFEGFFIPPDDPRYPSLAQRNNNPGNIRPIGANEGFMGYSTPSEGWRALRKQILINIGRGLTLDQFFLGKEGVYPGYTPLGPGTGNTEEQLEAYLTFVSQTLRVSREMDLRMYFPDMIKEPIISTLYWGFPV